MILGVVGETLFDVRAPGLNVAMGTGILSAALLLVARWSGTGLMGGGRWLFIPAVLFALGFAWRDSPSLAAANTIGLLTCLTLAVSYSRVGRIVIADLGGYMAAGIRLAVYLMIGPMLLLFQDTNWTGVPSRGWTGQAMAVGRGAVLAVPLLLLFGGLLVSADAAFSGIVSMLLDWDLEEVARHLFWMGLWSWVAAGMMRETLLAERGAPGGSGRTRPSLGIVETATVLASLDLLFLAFVLVQLRYFFGGAALVEASVSLTHAEYARRGFFELVAVATLALPVLLAGDAMLRREKPAHDRLYRLLAGALVAMLFVVVASALQRMRLYQEEFGQTELRLYTTAFMIWLALLLVWFVATVLRGRRHYFAFGAMLAGFMTITALNVLNPDAMIVSTNLQRAQEGKRFDAGYLTSLSADAVPGLVVALPSLPEAEHTKVSTALERRWSRPPSDDPRSWNWSRAAADWAMEAERELSRR